MTLQTQKPFQPMKLEEERNPDDIVISVRITPTDRSILHPAKVILQQPKLSTTIKQLAMIGAANVVNDEKVKRLIEIMLDNQRRNARMGISDKEIKSFKK